MTLAGDLDSTAGLTNKVCNMLFSGGTNVHLVSVNYREQIRSCVPSLDGSIKTDVLYYSSQKNTAGCVQHIISTILVGKPYERKKQETRDEVDTLPPISYYEMVNNLD